MNPQNRGLNIRPLEIGIDYVFGDRSLNAGGVVLRPDGQWDAFVPPDELQAPGYETNACVSFSTTSALETLLNRLYNRTDNFSDRFVAKGSGTGPAGNTYQAVFDFIRHSGAVTEDVWPTSRAHTYAEFYDELPPWLFPVAQAFPAQFEYKYDYVPLAYANLKAALTYSPLSFGLYAWQLKPGSSDIYYKPEGATPNHAVVCYGYVEGQYWKIFDSYDNTHKKYDWACLPDIAFRHTLTPNVVKDDFFRTFLKWLIQIFPFATDSLTKMLEEDAKDPALAPVVPQEVPPAPTPTPVPPAPHKSRIRDWALAIQTQEGGHPTDLNVVLNNPGNLKFSAYTKSLGGKQSVPGQDGGSFCKFDTYEAGLTALCQFLTDGANDKLKAYHKSRTLLAFTRTYANPPGDGYATRVAQALGVSVDIDIKNLL